MQAELQGAGILEDADLLIRTLFQNEILPDGTVDPTKISTQDLEGRGLSIDVERLTTAEALNYRAELRREGKPNLAGTIWVGIINNLAALRGVKVICPQNIQYSEEELRLMQGQIFNAYQCTDNGNTAHGHIVCNLTVPNSKHKRNALKLALTDLMNKNLILISNYQPSGM